MNGMSAHESRGKIRGFLSRSALRRVPQCIRRRTRRVKWGASRATRPRFALATHLPVIDHDGPAPSRRSYAPSATTASLRGERPLGRARRHLRHTLRAAPRLLAVVHGAHAPDLLFTRRSGRAAIAISLGGGSPMSILGLRQRAGALRHRGCDHRPDRPLGVANRIAPADARALGRGRHVPHRSARYRHDWMRGATARFRKARSTSRGVRDPGALQTVSPLSEEGPGSDFRQKCPSR